MPTSKRAQPDFERDHDDCDPFSSRTFPAGVAQVYIDDIQFSYVDVPEPATMVILGLGGLLLRRNKK